MSDVGFFVIETIIKCVFVVAVFATLAGVATYLEKKGFSFIPSPFRA